VCPLTGWRLGPRIFLRILAGAPGIPPAREGETENVMLTRSVGELTLKGFCCPPVTTQNVLRLKA
jgi:hypothetical protein